MPRHKATPKKHGNESADATSNDLISTKSESDDLVITDEDCDMIRSRSTASLPTEPDEVLDLSVSKKRKTISPNLEDQSESKDLPRNLSTKRPSTSVADKPNVISPYHHPAYVSAAQYFGLGSLFSQQKPLSSTTPVSQISTLVGQASSSSTVSHRGGQSAQGSSDSLSKLSRLVSKVGQTNQPATDFALPTNVDAATAMSAPEFVGANGLNFQELWWRFVKKEENAEIKRMNEAKQIFTCLQCHASFQTMDQLVKHMESTQHFANIPKHYSWSLQYARQKMRQMKMKMKYSDKMMYFCFLCQSPFTEPVHVHFNCAHNMHNPAENMKFVQIISVGNDQRSTSYKRKTVSPTTNGTSAMASCGDSTSPMSASFSNESDAGSPDKMVVDAALALDGRRGVRQQEEQLATIRGSKAKNLLSKMEELVNSASKIASSTTDRHKK